MGRSVWRQKGVRCCGGGDTVLPDIAVGDMDEIERGKRRACRSGETHPQCHVLGLEHQYRPCEDQTRCEDQRMRWIVTR